MRGKFNSVCLKITKNRTKIGFLFSALYAILLIWMIVYRWPDINTLQLNELGDFTAGAFGPLAMMWLVLGYLQQGDELKQNTDALRLQAQELANTVQQQKELVALGHAQLQREKELAEEERSRKIAAARPKFEFSIPSGAREEDGWILLQIDAKNVGAVCSHLRVYSDTKGLYVSWSTNPQNSQFWNITAQGPVSEPFDCFDFFVAYLDVAGNMGEQRVSVSSYADEDTFGHVVSGEDDQKLLEERARSRRFQKENL